MSSYRRVLTRSWRDKWLHSLDAAGKALWFYLLTCDAQTACGAFECPIDIAALEVGMSEAQIVGYLRSWQPHVFWFEDHGIIFVRRFFEYQTAGPKFEIAARNASASLPLDVRMVMRQTYEWVSMPHGHCIDTVSIQYRYPKTSEQGCEIPPCICSDTDTKSDTASK